jgi:alpha-D-xyloside xylohydrolase
MPKTRLVLIAFSLTLLLLFTTTATAQWKEFNPVVGVQQQPDGVLLINKTGATRIQVCNDSILRLTYSPTGTFPKTNELIVTKTDWPAPSFKLESTDKDVTLITPRLRVNILKFNASITYSENTISYRDQQGNPVYKRLVNEESRTLTPAVVNGEKTYRAESFFNIYGSPEAIYGLGQQQAGVWNLRGASVDLSQENTNIAVPMFVSSFGYGVLWNNTSRSKFNNRFANYLYLSSEVADTIDYYFIYGPEFDQIIAGYRELSGQAPMFGKWAYGFWQCKNRYKSQDEILGVAHKYRELNIPIDNIVQDWFWWNRKGEHVFNSKFPDPKGMVDDLHKNNIHLMISVWPFFEPGSKEYDYMDKQGWFIEKFKYDKLPYHRAGMAVYDATSADARKYYWSLMDKALFNIGIDAWWLDTVEPETEGQQDNILIGHKVALGSGDRYVNAFPLLTTGGVYNGQRAASDQKRVFILSRSAFAGAQRNAITAWSGDINSDFESFKRQIPAGLNYAVSGLPYWTTDIGGFVSGNPDDPAYRELFIRWFQFGTFSPIFRVHGTRTTDQNELWSYGPEAQKILVNFDRLRYRLMPYIYSLAWKTTSESYTPMRPLVMDFRSDARVLNIGDQFMYGPAILVNPVTEPGATTRHLYLPKTKWFDFWTGSTVEGGKSIDAAAPLDRLPLYVRAGSIVPLGPDVEYAAEKPADPIELRIYKGADGSFTLYEDEDDTYNYEKGVHAVIPISWNEAQQRLTIGERKGQFPGMLERRTFHIVFVAEGHGTGVELTGKADKVVEYSGKQLVVE